MGGASPRESPDFEKKNRDKFLLTALLKRGPKSSRSEPAAGGVLSGPKTTKNHEIERISDLRAGQSTPETRASVRDVPEKVQKTLCESEMRAPKYGEGCP